MGKGILVTGGARSGKSNYAETLAKGLGENILYIATSIPFDDEMKDRVRKHRESRPSYWITYEGYKGLGKVLTENINELNLDSEINIAEIDKIKEIDGVLLDCVTVMITNLMFDNPDMHRDDYSNFDFNLVEAEIINEVKDLMKAVKESDKTVIFVTNEIGFGIVPETKLGRAFRDIAGRVNQYIAAACDEVYLTVCGIPIRIK
ncbi:MAG: bifunctional adenosylcobinamide kinase/adenosylcobinamide-phosphate guanylyltransferase [Clostridiaceae bacterium]